VLRGNREECTNHGHGTVFRAANGGNQSSRTKHRNAGGGDHFPRRPLRATATDGRDAARRRSGQAGFLKDDVGDVACSASLKRVAAEWIRRALLGAPRMLYPLERAPRRLARHGPEPAAYFG
jgi:hypothetical protein